MGAGNKAAAATILGISGALLLVGCDAQSSSGRTRASAEAAADVALARHEAASLQDRETLADMAVAACTELDDGRTGSEMSADIASEAASAGVDIVGEVVFTQIVGTLVEEHCPEHVERWWR